MLTDCPNCAAASERSWHRYTARCMVCEARRIAVGEACAEAKAKGVLTPAYRAELCAVVGEEHWLCMHELVKAWQRGADATTRSAA